MQAQRIAAKGLLVRLAPLHEQHKTLGAQLVQAQLPKLRGLAEPVQIGVRNGKAAFVLMHQSKSWAGDGGRAWNAQRPA